jgi:hypothetical protein
MIALTISSLMVAMILSIFTRMSTAYRSQQNIADLQRILISGQDLVQRDVRQAGFQLIDGFRVSGPTNIHPAVEIRDNASGFGPDELHVFYADPSAQARVLTFDSTSVTVDFGSFTVDDVDQFAIGDVIVISNREAAVVGTTIVTHNRACVAQISAINGTVFSVRTNGNWGEVGNNQCDETKSVHNVPSPTNTMVYRFVAHGYRLDATRRELGVLQLSASGGLVNDWQDLGLGFTDLQVASHWYEGEDDSGRQLTDTADLDSDPQRDWYSGVDQNALTALMGSPDNTRPLLTEIRVSFAVRTRQTLDAVASAASPAFIDAARPDNNDLGNRTSVTLAGVADSSRPVEMRGDAIFRYATVGTDVRNLAVAR